MSCLIVSDAWLSLVARLTAGAAAFGRPSSLVALAAAFVPPEPSRQLVPAFVVPAAALRTGSYLYIFHVCGRYVFSFT